MTAAGVYNQLAAHAETPPTAVSLDAGPQVLGTPAQTFAARSKLQFQVELNGTRIAGGSERPEGRRVAGILGQPKPLMAIEQVEDLSAKLHTHAFRHPEILLDSHVFVDHGAISNIRNRANIAEREGRRRRECSEVQVSAR